jgi:hypothetical protein
MLRKFSALENFDQSGNKSDAYDQHTAKAECEVMFKTQFQFTQILSRRKIIEMSLLKFLKRFGESSRLSFRLFF